MNTSRYVELTASVAAAHLHGTGMPTSDIPDFLRTIHSTLVSLDKGAPVTAEVSLRDAPPADVDVPLRDDADADADAEGFIRGGRRTLYDDHLVCLEDGKDVVLLVRHLRHLGLDPSAYREKWSLPDDYPMVAPRYSREKREIALRSNLGTAIRPRRERRLQGTLRPSYGARPPAGRDDPLHP